MLGVVLFGAFVCCMYGGMVEWAYLALGSRGLEVLSLSLFHSLTLRLGVCVCVYSLILMNGTIP